MEYNSKNERGYIHGLSYCYYAVIQAKIQKITFRVGCIWDKRNIYDGWSTNSIVFDRQKNQTNTPPNIEVNKKWITYWQLYKIHLYLKHKINNL